MHPRAGKRYYAFYEGCQRVAIFKERINFEGRKEFTFRNGEYLIAKPYREKNMNYTWSLYTFVDGNMELIDVLRIDLSGYYARYIEELMSYAS